MKGLAWHFDFHSHKTIRINHDPNVEEMAHLLMECGVEEIITFAKCHTGFAYYPTQVGTVHPRMKGDAFGDVVRACKAKGIRVLAYLSFGIDGEAGRRNPQWIQRRRRDELISDDWFINVCPFTPYLDELMLPMIEEILNNYPVDGFFFDTMSAMGLCYCAFCQQDFQVVYGGQIPCEPNDSGWAAYGQFRHRRSSLTLERIGTFIRDRKPNAKVGFNHIGTITHPEKTPAGLSCLTLDFNTATSQSQQASMSAAYGSTADLPADVMNTVFNQGWGDWSPRPMPILAQTAATIWARKCRPYLGDRLHPENRFDPVTIHALRFMAGVARQIQAQYPAEDSCLIPDVLILHGPFQMYGETFENFAISRTGLIPLRGAHHLLLDAGANFAITAEAFLDKHLTACKLVVVPEMMAIMPETESVLRHYVETGGKILMVGKIPHVDEKPLKWIGLIRETKPWQDHIYLPGWTPEESPILVCSPFCKLIIEQAQMVLPAIQPYDCLYGMRFGWGIGPASHQASPYAALTKMSVGQGEVWYLEPSIFTDYDGHANWTQFSWFRELLRRLVPQPAVRLISQSGSVEVVAHMNGKSTWVFLINHGGEQLHGEGRWARTFQPVPSYDTILEIHGAGRKPRSVAVDHHETDWTMSDGSIIVPMKMDAIWKILRVDWSCI